MARRPSTTAGSEFDDDAWIKSDAELGVGEEAAPPSDATARIEEALADPVIAKAIEQLVEKRAAELAVTTPGVPVGGPDFLTAMRELGKQIADSINRSTAATVEQMPGHIKPIPVEEVEARAAAFVERESMLKDITRRYWAAVEQGEMVKAEEITPLYVLDEDFFGPGDVGSEIYPVGATIRWFGPPALCMTPRNGIAKRLCEIERRHLGGEGAMSAEDLAAHASQMRRPSTPGAPVPEMPPLLSSHVGHGRPGVSIVTEAGIAERGAENIVGTVVKVTRGGFGAQAHMPPMSGPHQVRGPITADQLV